MALISITGCQGAENKEEPRETRGALMERIEQERKASQDGEEEKESQERAAPRHYSGRIA